MLSPFDNSSEPSCNTSVFLVLRNRHDHTAIYAFFCTFRHFAQRAF